MNYTLYQGDSCRRIERFPDLRRAERAIQSPLYEAPFHILIGRRASTILIPQSRVLRIYDRQCKLIYCTKDWPLGTETDIAKECLENV